MSEYEEWLNNFYADARSIIIRTTAVGSCLRKRQHIIRGVKDDYGTTVKPLPGHYYPIKGWISHTHIANWIDNGGDYKPNPLIPKKVMDEYKVTADMISALEQVALHDWLNFLTWTRETDVDLSKDNVIGTEHQIIMPLASPKDSSYRYAQQADLDLITKENIIDFKSGKKNYISKNKTQLGSYRRLARYMHLHENSPSGDFKLRNVFLGGEQPEKIIHDPKKISKERLITFHGASSYQ